MAASQGPSHQSNTLEETIVPIIQKWKKKHRSNQDKLSILIELMQMDENTKSKLRESLAETNENSDASNLWLKEGFYLFELKDIKNFINMSRIDLLAEYFNGKYHESFKSTNLFVIAPLLETILKEINPEELTQWIKKLNYGLVHRGILSHHFSNNDTLAHFLARKRNFSALQELASIDPTCLNYLNIKPVSFFGPEPEAITNPKTALDLIEAGEEKTEVKMIALRRLYLHHQNVFYELQFREKFAVDETDTAEFAHTSDKMLDVFSLALDAFAKTLENEEDKNHIRKAIQALCAVSYPSHYDAKELQENVNNLTPGQSIFIYGGFNGDIIGHHAIICYSKDDQGLLYRTECNAGFGSYTVDEHNCYGVCKQQIQAGKVNEVIAMDHSNFHSSEENYVAFNKNLDLLSAPIQGQSQLVGIQQTGNCNTRSTREFMRSLLPEPLFRKMYGYIVNTRPEEMLETIKAKYADNNSASSSSRSYLAKQVVYKKGEDIHKTTAYIIQTESYKSNPRLNMGSWKFTFADCVSGILRQNYPNLNLSRANKIIRDCVSIIHENSYNILTQVDYDKFCVRLFALNKPEISVLPKDDVIYYCKLFLLNQIIQSTFRDKKSSSLRVGFFSTKESDHTLSQAIEELVGRADWPEIKAELVEMPLPDTQLKVLADTFTQYEINHSSSSSSINPRK